MSKQECIWCHGTGEINGMGFLDCGHCDAAVERSALNAFIATNGGLHQYTLDDLAWLIHQRAVAMCEAKLHPFQADAPEPADVLKRRMDDK